MNNSGRHSSVFSAVSAPKVARKFDLAKISRLPVFVLPRGGDWSREFQGYLASGNHSWFVPRSSDAPIQVVCYQENAGVPFELVANGSSIANVWSAPTTDNVRGIRVRRPQIAGALAPCARNMEPVQLSIPVSHHGDDREAGFRGLLHRNGAEGTMLPALAGATFLKWLRSFTGLNADS